MYYLYNIVYFIVMLKINIIVYMSGFAIFMLLCLSDYDIVCIGQLCMFRRRYTWSVYVEECGWREHPWGTSILNWYYVSESLYKLCTLWCSLMGLGMLVYMSLLISICIFTASNALLMLSATAIVSAGGCFWLKTIMLFMLCIEDNYVIYVVYCCVRGVVTFVIVICSDVWNVVYDE